MLTISKRLADDTFEVFMDGETKSIKIVPQISSTLRRNLVFWQTEEADDEGSMKIFH